MHSHTGFYLAIEMLKHPVHTVSNLGMNIQGGSHASISLGWHKCSEMARLLNPNDAILQLAQSVLNIGFKLVKRWDRGK